MSQQPKRCPSERRGTGLTRSTTRVPKTTKNIIYHVLGWGSERAGAQVLLVLVCGAVGAIIRRGAEQLGQYLVRMVLYGTVRARSAPPLWHD